MTSLRYHPIVQRMKIRATKVSDWVAQKVKDAKPWFRKMLLFLRPSELPTAAVGPDGRYVLEEEFARGSTGILYRARDVRLDRNVALKQLFSHRRGESETLERFRKQAHVLASLAHPNIIHVFDFIEEAGNSWIAMELVNGESLEKRLSDGPLSVEETVRRGTEIADALGYAHKTGVVHRNLNPGNVLVDGKDRCKISNFGIATAPDPGGNGKAEEMHDSPALMSPEQASGDELDERADVYALGVSLFLMTTGTVPFRGNALEIVDQVRSEEPPSPRSLNPAVPEALDALILKMMAKDPSDRPQSMAEVKAALKKLN